MWGVMGKQALKRRNPGFNESYYGFSSFSKLLDEAESRNMLQLERDEKSGGYIVNSVAHGRPVTLHALNNECDPLSHADAHGAKRVTAADRLELIHRRSNEARAGRT